nr:hypothetical protein BaRGS_033742 [Batillaria attramentaria]
MCFHPWSDMTLPLMEVKAIRSVVDKWAEINKDLGESSFLPNELAIKDRTQRQYMEKHGKPMLVDYLEKELKKQRDSESASTVPRFCGLCDDHEVLADGHCNECADDLCSGCIHRHRRMRTVADHTIVIFSQQHQPLESSDGGGRAGLDSSHRRPFSPSISETEVVDRCHKHKTEDLRFYCKTCQLPVCRDCILTTHKQHLTDDITEASASALRDLSAMMSQLQEKKLLMESRLRSFHAYKSSFEESAQQVTEIVKTFYTEITEAVEASFKELTSDLQQCQETEAARIQNQEQNFHKSLQGVSRLLGQQTPIFNSPLAVLRQRDVVADALTSIDHNLDKLQVNSGEFLVSRNPRLTKIPANILGKVAFAVIRSSDNLKTDSPQPQASISEISLRRELAFNIWEMNCAKSSVKTIVEGSHGTVWVATPRSIIKKIGSSVTKDSAHIPDDIANISAAPDGKLLVSFGQGGAVKLYSNGSWSRGFTTMARSITSMASRELRGRSQVYVAETPQDDFPSRLLTD